LILKTNKTKGRLKVFRRPFHISIYLNIIQKNYDKNDYLLDYFNNDKNNQL